MAQFENGGYYECKVVDSGLSESKTGKNPMIILTVQPVYRILNYQTDEERRVSPESNSERQVRLTFSSEKQNEMNLKKLREAGWDGTNFVDFDMTGMYIVCKNAWTEGTGNNAGKTFDNFDLPLPGFTAEPIDKSKADSTGKKMNALLAGSMKSIPARPKREAPPVEVKREKAPEPTSKGSSTTSSEPDYSEDDSVPF